MFREDVARNLYRKLGKSCHDRYGFGQQQAAGTGGLKLDS